MLFTKTYKLLYYILEKEKIPETNFEDLDE